jgi:hypothetical protein
MSDKSHVSMERRVCLVCAAPYETGAILLDTRLRASLKRQTTTGWGLCPEHRELHENGFVALIECDPEKSGNPAAGARVKPDEAYRTGAVAHMKREVFSQVFNLPVAPDVPAVYVEVGLIARLQSMIHQPT